MSISVRAKCLAVTITLSNRRFIVELKAIKDKYLVINYFTVIRENILEGSSTEVIWVELLDKKGASTL